MAGLSPRADGVSLVLHCVLLHSGSKALVEPTMPALVPLVFVNHAGPTEPARVALALPHGPPEEALASVT